MGHSVQQGMAVAVTHSTVQYSEHWRVGHPCHTRPVLAGAGCLREGLHHTATTECAEWDWYSRILKGVVGLAMGHHTIKMDKVCKGTLPIK